MQSSIYYVVDYFCSGQNIPVTDGIVKSYFLRAIGMNQFAVINSVHIYTVRILSANPYILKKNKVTFSVGIFGNDKGGFEMRFSRLFGLFCQSRWMGFVIGTKNLRDKLLVIM